MLKHPTLLLQLQETVLKDGGDYWSKVPRLDNLEERIRANWQTLASALDVNSHPIRNLISEPVTFVVDSPKSPLQRTRRFIIGSITTTVAVAAAIWLSVPRAPNWGWDKPGALVGNLTPQEYLNRLAASAQEWFDDAPASGAALQKRLKQLRHGCDTLISSSHHPLSSTDRDWLVERCQSWREKIDRHLADLSRGDKSVETVRKDADETVNALASALRQRAEATASPLRSSSRRNGTVNDGTLPR